jgi:hypothetical protein
LNTGVPDLDDSDTANPENREVHPRRRPHHGRELRADSTSRERHPSPDFSVIEIRDAPSMGFKGNPVEC